MRKSSTLVVVLSICSMVCWAADPGMDVVLVTGEQPGPALWRVSSGDHVLWILGDVQPLPRKLKWRARKFERLLADSQEVILHVPQHRRLSGSDARVLVRTREFTGGHTLKEVI